MFPAIKSAIKSHSNQCCSLSFTQRSSASVYTKRVVTSQIVSSPLNSVQIHFATFITHNCPAYVRVCVPINRKSCDISSGLRLINSSERRSRCRCVFSIHCVSLASNNNANNITQSPFGTFKFNACTKWHFHQTNWCDAIAVAAAGQELRSEWAKRGQFIPSHTAPSSDRRSPSQWKSLE